MSSGCAAGADARLIASVGKAVHVIGMETLVILTTNHRLTAADVEAALAADPNADDVVAVVSGAVPP